MIPSRMFISYKNFNLFRGKTVVQRALLSSGSGDGSFDQLIRRLDRCLRKSSPDADHHQDVLDIAREFLREKRTLRENSVFLAKAHKYGRLKPEFWAQYLARLNESLAPADGKDEKGESRDASLDDLNLLSTFSNRLAYARLSSRPFAALFLRAALRNVYSMVPNKMRIFNSLLDYLAFVDHKERLPEQVFELLTDFAHQIKPFDLIHTMYALAQLGHKNEDMIRAFARVLNGLVALGHLTPYEKTKLVKAYSLFKHEHISLFGHITKELLFVFGNMDFGNYFYHDEPTEGPPLGFGSPKCDPSGVMVEGLQYIHTYSPESGQVLKHPEPVEFRGASTQIYTCGQMFSILDSMIYLRLHHLEPDFKKLVTYALKHLYKHEIVDRLDVEQLRCAVSILATCRKSVDDPLLEAITKRFVREYMAGMASNGQLSLFLKDLVKLTKIVVKRKNTRNKVLHNSAFVPPSWLNNTLHESPDPMDPNSSRSTLEHLCYKICDNVNTFPMEDLTACLRSVAYLGFRNEKFYSVFIPFFRQNMGSLSHVAVTNLTQSFNKAGVKDKYFYYLLGKQHQLHLHDTEDKVYIKRIG